MFERQISDKDVLRILQTGETIEDHADDVLYPNRLMLGWHGKHPLHVVAVDNPAEDEMIVITVYKPDPANGNLTSKDGNNEMHDLQPSRDRYR